MAKEIQKTFVIRVCNGSIRSTSLTSCVRDGIPIHAETS
jgi:hypothetical protein